MRKTIWQAVFALAGLVAMAGQAGAAPVAGTCAVTGIFNTLYGGLEGIATNRLGDRPKFPISVGAGLAFPVAIDSQAGTISLDRSDFGIGTFEIIGVANTLAMDGVVQGTIDAGGNVRLLNFTAAFGTEISDTTYPLSPTLATGLGATVYKSSVAYTQGVPLDFTTGVMTLEGHSTISPVPQIGAAASGVRLVCRLDPIPRQADLPKAPQLVKVGGVARIAAQLADGDKGDTLTLKAKLVAGATPPALDGSQDVFVLLANAERQFALLLVRAGKFQAKGKRLLASRDDTCVVKRNATSGTCRIPRGRTCKTASDCGQFETVNLDMVLGHKQSATAKSVLGGSAVLTRSGNLVVKAQGLDLSSLTGAATVTVQVGSQTASAPVTVTGSGAVRHLKSQKAM